MNYKEMTAVLRGICVSEKRGTPKSPVTSAKLIENYGIDTDAHAGNWHRQVSLLSYEKIEEFKNAGAQVEPGSFGENLIVEGINLKSMPIGTIIRIGGVILEVTQIGKQCHHHCLIYKKMGDCIMPREGIFARVLHGGDVSVGDSVKVQIPQSLFSAAVLTLSDKGYAGERKDESGLFITQKLQNLGYQIKSMKILPDEQSEIEKELIRLCDELNVDLVLTTGGTGFSKRDVTPEATLAVATRNVPGISEIIRSESYRITKRAMLSRAVSVIRNDTLIVNLPGSRKAVEECMNIIMDEIGHGLAILKGTDSNCGRL